MVDNFLSKKILVKVKSTHFLVKYFLSELQNRKFFLWIEIFLLKVLT